MWNAEPDTQALARLAPSEHQTVASVPHCRLPPSGNILSREFRIPLPAYRSPRIAPFP